eukprot:scaffold20935_cov69-Phaeocystis_antarctica.AAC.10
MCAGRVRTCCLANHGWSLPWPGTRGPSGPPLGASCSYPTVRPAASSGCGLVLGPSKRASAAAARGHAARSPRSRRRWSAARAPSWRAPPHSAHGACARATRAPRPPRAPRAASAAAAARRTARARAARAAPPRRLPRGAATWHGPPSADPRSASSPPCRPHTSWQPPRPLQIWQEPPRPSSAAVAAAPSDGGWRGPTVHAAAAACAAAACAAATPRTAHAARASGRPLPRACCPVPPRSRAGCAPPSGHSPDCISRVAASGDEPLLGDAPLLGDVPLLEGDIGRSEPCGEAGLVLPPRAADCGRWLAVCGRPADCGLDRPSNDVAEAWERAGESGANSSASNSSASNSRARGRKWRGGAPVIRLLAFLSRSAGGPFTLEAAPASFLEDGLRHVAPHILCVRLKLCIARPCKDLQPWQHARLLHERHVLGVAACVAHSTERILERERVVAEEVAEQLSERTQLLEHALGLFVPGVHGLG